MLLLLLLLFVVGIIFVIFVVIIYYLFFILIIINFLFFFITVITVIIIVIICCLPAKSVCLVLFKIALPQIILNLVSLVPPTFVFVASASHTQHADAWGLLEALAILAVDSIPLIALSLLL